MLQAILEGVATFGPMVVLMLTPILIPLSVEIIGFIADRRKLLTAGGATTLTRSDYAKAA